MEPDRGEEDSISWEAKISRSRGVRHRRCTTSRDGAMRHVRASNASTWRVSTAETSAGTHRIAVRSVLPWWRCARRRNRDARARATGWGVGMDDEAVAEQLDDTASGYDMFQTFLDSGLASGAKTETYTLPLPSLDTGDGRLVPAVILGSILFACWFGANFLAPSLLLGGREERNEVEDESK